MNGDETKEGNYGQREGIHQCMGKVTPPRNKYRYFKNQVELQYYLKHILNNARITNEILTKQVILVF